MLKTFCAILLLGAILTVPAFGIDIHIPFHRTPILTTPGIVSVFDVTDQQFVNWCADGLTWGHTYDLELDVPEDDSGQTVSVDVFFDSNPIGPVKVYVTGRPLFVYRVDLEEAGLAVFPLPPGTPFKIRVSTTWWGSTTDIQLHY